MLSPGHRVRPLTRRNCSSIRTSWPKSWVSPARPSTTSSTAASRSPATWLASWRASAVIRRATGSSSSLKRRGPIQPRPSGSSAPRMTRRSSKGFATAPLRSRPSIQTWSSLPSVDLTIGDLVMRAGASAHRLSEGRSLRARSGRTREPADAGDARISRRLRRAGSARWRAFRASGIFTALGLQVDPGFHGELEFCLFNAGTRSYPLALGAPIISLEIMRLARAHSRAKVVVPHDRSDVAKHFDVALARAARGDGWLRASGPSARTIATRRVLPGSALKSAAESEEDADRRKGRNRTGCVPVRLRELGARRRDRVVPRLLWPARQPLLSQLR